MTINEAVKAAMTEWRAENPDTPVQSIREQLEWLVDEAITEWCDEHDEDAEPGW